MHTGISGGEHDPRQRDPPPLYEPRQIGHSILARGTREPRHMYLFFFFFSRLLERVSRYVATIQSLSSLPYPFPCLPPPRVLARLCEEARVLPIGPPKLRSAMADSPSILNGGGQSTQRCRYLHSYVAHFLILFGRRLFKQRGQSSTSCCIITASVGHTPPA